MGGGTLGFSLAREGFTVLFLEEGRDKPSVEPVPELSSGFAGRAPTARRRYLRGAGRYWKPLDDVSAGGAERRLFKETAQQISEKGKDHQRDGKVYKGRM